MGLKRVAAIIEVVYAGDDPRSLLELKQRTKEGCVYGVRTEEGLLAAFAVTGASVDPDPEPVADEVPSSG